MVSARVLWGAIFLGLAACGHTPVTRTISETFFDSPGVGAIALNPSYRYLRVSADGREALMVLGYVDPQPLGDVETWYSASGEVLKLQNGRITSTSGLKPDWREVRYSELPSWSSLVGMSAARFKRERDEMPGHRFGIQEVVEISSVQPPADARLSGLSAATLRWFEERVVASPKPEPSARYGLSSRNDGTQPVVVYGEQCLRPDFCIAWQVWPVDPPRAAVVP